MKVEIENKTQAQISEKEINKVVIATKEILQLPETVSVTIFFVEEDEIKKINSWTRKIDKITDVLSFPMQDFADLKEDVEGNVFLGDIVVCPTYAFVNAPKEGRKAKEEIIFLVVHGLLHLCGYNHDVENKQKEMEAMTNKIINYFQQS